MRILGIDPGLTRCGVGIIHVSARRQLSFEHVEVLRSAPDAPLPSRLALLGTGLEAIITRGDVDAVSLERVFAQQNLPSVMGVAQISGIVMFLAERAGVPVTLYTPNEVKSRVTGYGAADKSQVTNMVMKHLGLKTPPKPADAADALALAITHALSTPYAGRKTTPLGSAIAAGAAAATGPRGGSATTPAQEAWLAAERAAKRR
ncbi:crossover junction endodeoxyribonuclease RuvC [Leucobacter sp. UCMA 4100]|uniref:crossover junction endodeoxyribonuclease RuvC n=1 Tax=Leucobacter sp. UCMA 4100 TaxID=2810534 RepID=UPI0022EB9F4A|nr:crossover junction endodeoxyribonuclease RuvC [Leucobacter sp. UCMA 4100]MDA3148248.1 crossover junction endodeoxyribonuclease RuvC [Leucobacter sp. UCMA 4100]